jgi:hypothetical protein
MSTVDNPQAEDIIALTLLPEGHELDDAAMDRARAVVEALQATGMLIDVPGVDDARGWIVEGLSDQAEDLDQFLSAGMAEEGTEHHARVTEAIVAYRAIASWLAATVEDEDDGKTLIAGVLYDTETGEEADPQ